MTPLRLVFCGTPEFALPSLRALVQAGHAVLGVLTQPDRPQGRGQKAAPPPAKRLAEELGLSVWQPARPKEPEFILSLERLAPDALVLVAYGEWIPPAILHLPRFGCINAHPSLLPAYRGAAPIQRAIWDGAAETGVSTMYMAEGFDTGDIILQRGIPIGPAEDAGALHDRLAALSADLLLETLERVVQGTAPRIPQDHARATYAEKIERTDCRIDWRRSAGQLHNQIRALSPAPGAYTHHRGRRLKVWRAALPALGAPPAAAAPGTVLASDPEGIAVQTGAGPLLLCAVQPENGRSMSAGDYVNGYRLASGERLDEAT